MTQYDYYTPKLQSQQNKLSGAITKLGGIAKGAAPSDGLQSAPLTGTLVETTLKTIILPALQANTQISIYYMWGMTNNASTQLLKMYLNGVDIGINDLRATADWADGLVRIQNMNNTSSQICSAQGVGSHSGQPKQMTVDTSVPTTLTVKGTLNNAANSMQLKCFQVQIVNPL